ncbi:Putative nuclease [Frankliniella fusca]|uniref:Nuclease n=1 Tax=Frankliniella fusca TaxID=407009 RepID=A0AAE1LHG0_9NEOP|nr:Putative nuclease [Frankliniella fusca]
MRILTPYLPNYDSPLAVRNDVKVLSVLSFYATGSYQAAIAAGFLTCLGRSTIGRYIEEVTTALNHPDLQRKWIKFPRTAAERERVKARNEREFGIPGVVGSVDGTDVSITKPPDALNPQSFWTRKHHYAINCQVAADCNMVILSVNASYPGSTNDAFIWRHAPLKRRLMEAFQEDQSSWLLGIQKNIKYDCFILLFKRDSAYPTEPWMLIPILDAPKESAEAHYTRMHCHARCSIERTFGILKGRWRCLLRDRKLHYSPAKCARIIKACCLLHNFCRLVRIFHILYLPLPYFSTPTFRRSILNLQSNLDDDDVEFPLGEEEPLYFVPRAEEVAAVEAAAEEGLEEEFQVMEDATPARILNWGRPSGSVLSTT